MTLDDYFLARRRADTAGQRTAQQELTVGIRDNPALLADCEAWVAAHPIEIRDKCYSTRREFDFISQAMEAARVG